MPAGRRATRPDSTTYNAVFQANGDNQSQHVHDCLEHKLDKQLTWYIDAADTVNDGNAHYDIGAGGHGIKTDCHDGTNIVFTDLQQRGPHDLGRLSRGGILDRIDLQVLIGSCLEGSWPQRLEPSITDRSTAGSAVAGMGRLARFLRRAAVVAPG